MMEYPEMVNTLAEKMMWRTRYWRRPHHRWSSAWHQWQRGVVEDGRRVFTCARCGTRRLVSPPHLAAPLLRKGDTVLAEGME